MQHMLFKATVTNSFHEDATHASYETVSSFDQFTIQNNLEVVVYCTYMYIVQYIQVVQGRMLRTFYEDNMLIAS